MTISLAAQIAACQTAARLTQSPTERACLNEAVRTLRAVKAERERGQVAVAEITSAIRSTR